MRVLTVLMLLMCAGTVMVDAIYCYLFFFPGFNLHPTPASRTKGAASR